MTAYSLVVQVVGESISLVDLVTVIVPGPKALAFLKTSHHLTVASGCTVPRPMRQRSEQQEQDINRLLQVSAKYMHSHSVGCTFVEFEYVGDSAQPQPQCNRCPDDGAVSHNACSIAPGRGRISILVSLSHLLSAFIVFICFESRQHFSSQYYGHKVLYGGWNKSPLVVLNVRTHCGDRFLNILSQLQPGIRVKSLTARCSIR